MTADLIFTGGAVFQGMGNPPVRASVAVTAGRISGLLPEGDISEAVGADTEVIDMDGGLLTPGFIDAHVHPVYAGTAMLRCELHGLRTATECVDKVAEYAAQNPDAEWISGGGWSMEGFTGGTPTRQLLDAVVPDRPVYLPNRDGHGAWVNTRALELAEVTRDTPDPSDGRIEREPDGVPSGCLHEGAMALVGSLVPSPSDQDYDKALGAAQKYLFSLGITGWQDAIVGETNGRPDPLDAYLRAAADGRLKARVVGALWWERASGPEQIEALVERRERGTLGRFAATSIKIMQDGVAENFTAAMLSPYLDQAGRPNANSGLSFVPPQELDTCVTALDALGFQVHFHAIGDRAVREALNAVEVARTTNGESDNRHHIAHIQVIHPDDLTRFGALGVTANMQPLWACHEPQMDELTIPYLGEPRWQHQYPFKALQDAGARLCGGSDWSVSSPDVLWGAHVAVNRLAPPEERAGDARVFLPDQRLDLVATLTAYTQGSAYVNHLDDVTGTIELGKLADLVVLDRNPFDGPVEEISAARVVGTWIEGERVFAAGDAG